MTIEEILDLPAKDLSTITDEQYLEWFTKQGYLNVVRPELVARPVAKQTTIDYVMVKKLEELKRVTGIDASHLLRKKSSWKR